MFFEGRKLTLEQEQVLEHVPSRPDEKIVVNAFAGCGKTTTLRALVNHKHELRQKRVYGMNESDRSKKFLYIVYNVEMEKAARQAFCDDSESIVKICTNHALALAFMKHHLKEEGIMSNDPNNQPKFEFDDRGLVFGKHSEYNLHTTQTLENFCRDPSFEYTEPQPWHLPANVQNDGDRSRKILLEAQELWNEAIHLRKRAVRTNSDFLNKEETVTCLTYDVVLKYFSLFGKESEAYIEERYHTMLVDEAQDVQPPLMSWILDRVTLFPIYLVGDTQQSIYAFNGAKDAIEKALQHSKTVPFYLTQSFRFGSKIAQLATSILHLTNMLQSNFFIKGNDSHRGPGTVYCLDHFFVPELAHEMVRTVHSRTGSKDIAFLSRSNQCILEAACHVYTHGYHVRLTGAILKWVQTIVKLLGKFSSHEQAVKYSMALQRKKTMYENDQFAENVYQRLQDGVGNQYVSRNVLDLQKKIELLQQRNPRWFPKEHDEEYSDSGFMDGSNAITDWERFEIDIIRECGDQFETIQELFKGMLDQTEAKVIPENTLLITFGTVYAAKGNEWDTVILLDDFSELELMNRALYNPKFGKADVDSYLKEYENVLTHSVASSETSMRKYLATREKIPLIQEIHLCYVAVTRAKFNVFINAGTHRFLQNHGIDLPMHSIGSTVQKMAEKTLVSRFLQ